MQGFIIFNEYAHRYGEFRQAMEVLVRDGRIKYREDVVEGLENAPRGLIRLLRGENAGKRIVRVGPNEKGAL